MLYYYAWTGNAPLVEIAVLFAISLHTLYVGISQYMNYIYRAINLERPLYIPRRPQQNSTKERKVYMAVQMHIWKIRNPVNRFIYLFGEYLYYFSDTLLKDLYMFYKFFYLFQIIRLVNSNICATKQIIQYIGSSCKYCQHPIKCISKYLYMFRSKACFFTNDSFVIFMF